MERQQPGRHLVQHGAKGKQICSCVEFFAQRLFRGHVRHGTQGSARTGQVLETGSGCRLDHDPCSLHPSGGRNLGQAEIKNLGVPTPGYKNVCRLDVSMDDAFGVGGIESVGNLDAEG